jgi:hypothetical protein
MTFFIFLLVAGIAYLIWRIADQLPDLIFRVSEMQRDLAELRRAVTEPPSRIDTPAPPAAGEPHAPPPAGEHRID